MSSVRNLMYLTKISFTAPQRPLFILISPCLSGIACDWEGFTLPTKAPEVANSPLFEWNWW